MINLTTNLKLKKPTDEESFDVEHMNSNNDVIDKSVGELENKLKNMKLESTAIDVVDTANNFTANSSGKKLLEDVLVEINTKAKEAFQGADSGKKIIATAIGSPILPEDTFLDMGRKIDDLTNTLKTNLKNKGVDTSTLNKQNELINAIPNMPSKRWASGQLGDYGTLYINGSVSYNGPKSGELVVTMNLNFTPSIIFVLHGNCRPSDSAYDHVRDFVVSSERPTEIAAYTHGTISIVDISNKSFKLVAEFSSRLDLSAYKWWAFE